MQAYIVHMNIVAGDARVRVEAQSPGEAADGALGAVLGFNERLDGFIRIDDADITSITPEE